MSTEQDLIVEQALQIFHDKAKIHDLQQRMAKIRDIVEAGGEIKAADIIMLTQY